MAGREGDLLPYLPARLKELRTELGWTLEDVAKRVGVTQAAVVSNWEATNQRRRTPELATLLILQRWYGVSFDYLLGQPDSDRDSPAVKAGKLALRKRLQQERFDLTTPAYRANTVVTISSQVAPDAFFLERLASNLFMTVEQLEEIMEHGFWPGRLIDQLSTFLSIEREWFYTPEPSLVLDRS